MHYYSLFSKDFDVHVHVVQTFLLAFAVYVHVYLLKYIVLHHCLSCGVATCTCSLFLVGAHVHVCTVEDKPPWLISLSSALTHCFVLCCGKKNSMTINPEDHLIY